MTFVLINKIIVILLILALMVLLFIKKKKKDSVFILSIGTLFIWLVNIVTDGYFWVKFVELSLSQIGVLLLFDAWSKNVMYILMGIISVVLLVKALKRKEEKEKMEQEEYNIDNEI